MAQSNFTNSGRLSGQFSNQFSDDFRINQSQLFFHQFDHLQLDFSPISNDYLGPFAADGPSPISPILVDFRVNFQTNFQTTFESIPVQLLAPFLNPIGGVD